MGQRRVKCDLILALNGIQIEINANQFPGFQFETIFGEKIYLYMHLFIDFFKKCFFFCYFYQCKNCENFPHLEFEQFNLYKSRSQKMYKYG